MPKYFPKILVLLFLTFFTFILLTTSALAAAQFTPQVGIGQDFQTGQAVTVSQSTETIAIYVRAIYKYAIGIVGILAAVVLMFGGIIWLTAGGNATQIGNAKAWIGASLSGLVLALLSYLILATVNPALVNFKISGVEPPPIPQEEPATITTPVGCCDGFCQVATSQTKCTDLGGTWNPAGAFAFECRVQTGTKGKCVQTTVATNGCCSYSLNACGASGSEQECKQNYCTKNGLNTEMCTYYIGRQCVSTGTTQGSVCKIVNTGGASGSW